MPRLPSPHSSFPSSALGLCLSQVLINSCWAGRELLELKRFECSNQIRFASPGCDSWDYVVQVLFHIGLEVVPVVIGAVMGLQEATLRDVIGASSPSPPF